MNDVLERVLKETLMVRCTSKVAQYLSAGLRYYKKEKNNLQKGIRSTC